MLLQIGIVDSKCLTMACLIVRLYFSFKDGITNAISSFKMTKNNLFMTNSQIANYLKISDLQQTFLSISETVYLV